MPNVPGNPDRRCVIMGWSTTRTTTKCMLPHSHVAELDALGRLTPTFRKLIGAAPP
jgi:hypothetical protein